MALTSTATTPAEYLASLPEDRKNAMTELRRVIKSRLPNGFKERMSGMLHYEVPLSRYPDGYHCNPKSPLPFISLASQKNFIAVYHFGMYTNPDLYHWFVEEYPRHAKRKLDMGKSCLRLKKMDDIPFDLIGDLVAKLTVEEWIKIYEKNIKK